MYASIRHFVDRELSRYAPADTTVVNLDGVVSMMWRQTERTVILSLAENSSSANGVALLGDNVTKKCVGVEFLLSNPLPDCVKVQLEQMRMQEYTA